MGFRWGLRWLGNLDRVGALVSWQQLGQEVELCRCCSGVIIKQFQRQREKNSMETLAHEDSGETGGLNSVR